jgi:carbon storage regulator CsrA
MALSLSRKRGEVLVIGGNIRIVVNEVRGGLVRLSIEAPPEVTIERGEHMNDDG